MFFDVASVMPVDGRFNFDVVVFGVFVGGVRGGVSSGLARDLSAVVGDRTGEQKSRSILSRCCPLSDYP